MHYFSKIGDFPIELILPTFSIFHKLYFFMNIEVCILCKGGVVAHSVRHQIRDQ